MSTGWVIGFTALGVVVVAVVALVVTIIALAHSIAKQAKDIDDSLAESVRNTAALSQLTTTIDHAQVIVDGLHRGRTRLGG
jgi:pilus assembly protein TadC